MTVIHDGIDLLDEIDALVAEATALTRAIRHPRIEDHIAQARRALRGERNE